MRFTIGDEKAGERERRILSPRPFTPPGLKTGTMVTQQCPRGFLPLVSLHWLILYISLSALSPAGAENFSVATVDMQALFKEYPETSRAQKKFEDLAREKKQDLDDSQEVLRDLQTELGKPKSALSRKERKLKEKEFTEATQDYEDEKNRIQNELDERNQEMTRVLTGRIREVVARIAKKEGCDLVLDSNDAVCVKFGTDLTNEVLRDFAQLKPDQSDSDSDIP